MTDSDSTMVPRRRIGVPGVRRRSRCCGALALVLATLAPALAAAQTPPGGAQPGSWQVAAAVPDTWQFAASLYGWYASIGGTLNFPVVGASTDINIDANTLVHNLNMLAMGAFDVHRGPWGGFVDVVYMNVGGGKSNTRDFAIGGAGIPAGTTADLHLGMKSWIWTIAGEYRAVSDPALMLDLLAGARYLDLTNSLNWSISGALGPLPPASATGASEVNGNVWDGIVGVKARYAFGADRRWIVPAYLDGGTGNSHYTIQAALGVGYAFRWGEVTAMWRYLDYKLQSGGRLENLDVNGPLIGASFRW